MTLVTTGSTSPRGTVRVGRAELLLLIDLVSDVLGPTISYGAHGPNVKEYDTPEDALRDMLGDEAHHLGARPGDIPTTVEEMHSSAPRTPVHPPELTQEATS